MAVRQKKCNFAIMTTFRTYLYIVLAFAAASCGHGSKSSSDNEHGDTLTTNAGLLDIVRHNGYTEVKIHDPWSSGRLLAHLSLVQRGESATAVAEGSTLVRVPLERTVIYSSVHTTPVFELGRGEAVTAVADGRWFADSDTVSTLLAGGRIADIGSSSSPSIEKIIALEADAVLLSPMQDGDNGAMSRTGIAVVPMADYMERTPLGRAEWLLLLGELYGAQEEADSIYSAVCADYDRIRGIASAAADRPRVLTETLTSGVWYVPGGASYMATMLADAGADYPWSDNLSEGSLALDASAVLDRAGDADVWLLRYFGAVPGYADIARDNRVASHIKAYRDRNIYVCDTSSNNIFNDIAFHPERVLRDFAIIFHPEAMPGETAVYYRRL